MKKLLPVSFFAILYCAVANFLFAFGPGSKIPGSKIILVVFAHPDDESAIGQLLVKYGRTNKIYLIVLTDGRLGVRTGFPGGDTLAAIRQTETQCACKIFNIEPPVFLHFPDGFDTRIGVANYLKQSLLLKQQLAEKIKAIRPDLIITFGPDGDTGHSDHRMAGNMTTEVILKEGWAERYPLYYLGWTPKDDDKFKIIGGLNTVDTAYLNITVRYSNDEEEQALKALDCYKSQLTEKEVIEWKTVERNDSSNVFHFRRLLVDTKKQNGFNR